MRLLKTLGLLALLLPGTMALAEPHSSVEPSVKPHGAGLQFDFKVNFPPNLHVNLEAPWSLELKATPGLSFKQSKWSKAELDQGLPGFHASTTAKPSQAAGTLAYALTAFVCTNDKTLCYRDVLPGEVAWKAP